jgi:hypothetical protein
VGAVELGIDFDQVEHGGDVLRQEVSVSVYPDHWQMQA